MIPPSGYSYIEYPRQSCRDNNNDIESKNNRIIENKENRICKGKE